VQDHFSSLAHPHYQGRRIGFCDALRPITRENNLKTPIGLEVFLIVEKTQMIQRPGRASVSP
jgi:hypothetical protein